VLAPPSVGLKLAASLRTISWLDTSFEAEAQIENQGPRVVDRDAATDTFFFGDLQARFFSLTLQQAVLFTPQMSLQLYAQLFTAYGQYLLYREATPQGARIGLPDLAATSYALDHDYQEAQLNLNVQLRWEYRPGSTLYAVFTKGMQTIPTAAPPTLWPERLSQGRSTDAFMVKWTYWWSP
jgi:hypothetical protein